MIRILTTMVKSYEIAYVFCDKIPPNSKVFTEGVSLESSDSMLGI